MANVDRPQGLRYVGSLTAAKMNGKVRTYNVDSSNSAAIGIGDPVTLEADGNVTRAAAGGLILGVCVGRHIVDGSDGFGAGTTPHAELNLQNKHVAASTAATVLVNIDPDAIYEAQEDSAVSNLALVDVGSNVDILSPAPSATTGLSLVELDSDSVVATTAQLRIVGLVKAPDNEVGTNAKWLVKINESHWTAAGI